MNRVPSNSLVSFEQQRRGFKLFTAAKEFVIGWNAYHTYDFRGALASFKRVAELDPENPYAHAYLLFAMEDSMDYTIQQLADRAALWHSSAVKFKHHGLDALSIIWFSKYIKMLEPVENGDLNPSNSTGLENI
jgi:hypothetical protein